MILAYHVIWGAYGFWLPNDPRGSWSETIRCIDLLQYGPATKVNTTRSVAHAAHDRDQRLAAKRALKYPPVMLTGPQAKCIGDAFAGQVERSGLVIHACAILPDHVHLVVRRHHYPIEQVVNLLKGVATTALLRQNLHPLAGHADSRGRTPSPWCQGLWKVFLDNEAAIVREVAYVERNPEMAGLPPQRWSCVTAPVDQHGPAGRR